MLTRCLAPTPFAGCVPIAYGAPNMRADYLPANNSVILVDDFVGPDKKVDGAALAAEVKRAITDKEVFERYMAWRTLPFEQLNPGYRALLTSDYFTQPFGFPRCQLCRRLAEKKLERLLRPTAMQ